MGIGCLRVGGYLGVEVGYLVAVVGYLVAVIGYPGVVDCLGGGGWCSHATVPWSFGCTSWWRGAATGERLQPFDHQTVVRLHELMRRGGSADGQRLG